jgi:hypothetical protein
MAKTLTRMDTFMVNIRALGYPGTRDEWDDWTSAVRMAIRLGIPPKDDNQKVVFDVVQEIWGDLL